MGYRNEENTKVEGRILERSGGRGGIGDIYDQDTLYIRIKLSKNIFLNFQLKIKNKLK